MATISPVPSRDAVAEPAACANIGCSNHERGSMKPERNDALTREILEAVESQANLTQRGLAAELGVALGLANSYLRRCVRKGLVKIKQAPANRYAYYLTPKGFAEKSRLTAEYLRASFDYYHRAGDSIATCLAAIEAGGGHRVLLAGMSELAEIASVRSHDRALIIIGTFDPGATTDRFLGLPVWRRVADAAPFDAVLFTALAEPERVHALLLEDLSAERVTVPDVLASILGTVPGPN